MTKDSDVQVSPSRLPIRERIGLVVNGANAATAIKTIAAAEIAGIRQIWMTNTPWFPDVLPTLAAAARPLANSERASGRPRYHCPS